MNNLILVSSFDPINNENIEDIKKFNSPDTIFYFCILFSRYSSIKSRQEMIDLALKDSGVKYQYLITLSELPMNTVDLSSIINDLHHNKINDVKFIIHDDKSYLVNEDKILSTKGKLKVNENAFDHSKGIRVLQNLNIPKVIIDYIVTNHLYFMPLIENFIKGKRLEHCISVANTAYDIAISNKLDRPDLYYIAGILHDVGKQASNDESIDIMEKYYRCYIDMPSFSLHEFVGAVYAQKLFPSVNKECIKAILSHATGDENMTPMQKVIYASDKIEPTRGYDSSELIKCCKENYDNGFLIVLDKNMEFISQENGSPSMNFFTKRCLKCYLSKWIK